MDTESPGNVTDELLVSSSEYWDPAKVKNVDNKNFRYIFNILGNDSISGFQVINLIQWHAV